MGKTIAVLATSEATDVETWHDRKVRTGNRAGHFARLVAREEGA